ncbi:hypothetical protein AGMMS50229_02460 [Campylobacterota bacterium]|nr:hypothetical protein AGMMS50229_02460 [Campylobacterota bacterium]
MNLEALAESGGMDVEDLEMLLAVFKPSVTDALGKLKAAAAANDMEGARFALHKIAGSSAPLFGIGEVNTIARAGETTIRDGGTVDAAALAQQIEQILTAAEVL